MCISNHYDLLFQTRIQSPPPTAALRQASPKPCDAPWQALDAAGVAWADGGLEKLDRMRCGILLGSAMGGMKTFATAIETLHTQVRPRR